MAECRSFPPCYTIDSLRSIVRSVRAAKGLPLLATIIPANPNLNPPERNDWVEQMDGLIRPMAREEGAVLVDLYAAFDAQTLPPLFSDHVHPNDTGYDIMARTFFGAVSRPAGAGGASWEIEDLLVGPGPTQGGGLRSGARRTPSASRRRGRSG